jgi:hypothetical protein
MTTTTTKPTSRAQAICMAAVSMSHRAPRDDDGEALTRPRHSPLTTLTTSADGCAASW